MREKATHYKTSNKFSINYLISKGFNFEEEVVENEYEGKISYVFSFPIQQDGINEAINYIKECRENKKYLEFPEKSNKEQLSFKESNKMRWTAIELCFPEVRDR